MCERRRSFGVGVEMPFFGWSGLAICANECALGITFVHV